MYLEKAKTISPFSHKGKFYEIGDIVEAEEYKIHEFVCIGLVEKMQEKVQDKMIKEPEVKKEIKRKIKKGVKKR